MDDPRRTRLPTSRGRIGWWAFVLGLVGAALFVAFHLVGTLTLGVFGYYAMRPIRDRIGSVVGSNRGAAAMTVSVVFVPVLLVLGYLLFRVARRVRPLLNGSLSAPLVGRVDAVKSLSADQREGLKALLRDPAAALAGQGGSILSNTDLAAQVLGAVFGALLLVALAVLLSYVLLSRDGELSAVFVELVGGRDTTVYAYCAAVDEDLESVFFGNLLFATVMAVVATAAYWATNLLAPAGVAVPLVPVLGLLTGVASLVPVVVGKLVYVPVVAYLGLQSTRSGGGLAFVGVVLLAYVLVLDLLPQAVVQPYVSGRRLDAMLLLFAYVLGPVVFGWYGFFLLPVLFVLLLEAVRLVVPELLDGESPRPSVELDVEPGTNPLEERDDVPEPEESSTGTGDGGSSASTDSTGETGDRSPPDSTSETSGGRSSPST